MLYLCNFPGTVPATGVPTLCRVLDWLWLYNIILRRYTFAFGLKTYTTVRFDLVNPGLPVVRETRGENHPENRTMISGRTIMLTYTVEPYTIDYNIILPTTAI